MKLGRSVHDGGCVFLGWHVSQCASVVCIFGQKNPVFEQRKLARVMISGQRRSCNIAKGGISIVDCAPICSSSAAPVTVTQKQ